MRISSTTLGVVMVLGAICAGCTNGCTTAAPRPIGTLTPAPEGAAWIDLLEDDRIGAWENVSDDADIFEITDNTLHIFGKSTFMLRYVAYTAQEFSDFDLHAEVKVAPGANSGIFLRANPDDPVQRGFEVQVLDDHGDAPNPHGSGAIYDVVSPMHNMAFPAGEWNAYDIAVRGDEVSVRLNGWLVVQSDFSQFTEPVGKFETPYAYLPKSGYIMVQDHGGEVWYRNFLVRPIVE